MCTTTCLFQLILVMDVIHPGRLAVSFTCDLVLIALLQCHKSRISFLPSLFLLLSDFTTIVFLEPVQVIRIGKHCTRLLAVARSACQSEELLLLAKHAHGDGALQASPGAGGGGGGRTKSQEPKNQEAALPWGGLEFSEVL
jgi:hypothetical protein